MPSLELVVDKAHKDPLRRLHAKSNDRHLDEPVLSTGAVGLQLARGRDGRLWYEMTSRFGHPTRLLRPPEGRPDAWRRQIPEDDAGDDDGGDVADGLEAAQLEQGEDDHDDLEDDSECPGPGT